MKEVKISLPAVINLEDIAIQVPNWERIPTVFVRGSINICGHRVGGPTTQFNLMHHLSPEAQTKLSEFITAFHEMDTAQLYTEISELPGISKVEPEGATANERIDRAIAVLRDRKYRGAGESGWLCIEAALKILKGEA